MTHPDPQIAASLERTARDLAEATAAPPAEIADDPAAYIAWLRNTEARAAQRPQRPRRDRPHLRRSEIPRVHRKGPQEPAQPRAKAFEVSSAYAAAAAVLSRLPDLGGGAIERARRELGDVPYEQLVIAAADKTSTSADTSGQRRTSVDTAEQNSTDLNASKRPGQGPECRECGTVLDPGGACFTCPTT